jgi:RND superfamily putative drug exporter
VETIGSTVSLRDLQQVTTDDLKRIEVVVPIVVFVILMVLLRELFVPIYLIATVLFSYLATLGVTFAVFWLLHPADFSGLDWKVPIFLFTILVAVGEDYNIFLMTRVKEEQKSQGPIEGVTQAVVKTGGIISSCGFIMAGTFASLMSGSLTEMKELGFALAFGVLLDTLVVRPLLVPAFVILLRRWQGVRRAHRPSTAKEAITR